MNLTGRPVHQKPEPEPDDPERIQAILAMPCCICHEWGYTQQSRTQVHHCIMGRHSFDRVSKTRRRAPDSFGIPLCEGHHQGLMDTSKIALHREPERWEDEYGKDTLWIGWVEERLNNT